MWFLSLVCAAALAADFELQTQAGGVSVDASGVSTPFDGGSDLHQGDDLVVQMPADAVVSRVLGFAAATRNLGFPPDYTNQMFINGVPLSSATLLEDDTITAVYELDPATFGITGAGVYSYAETGAADINFKAGQGVQGFTLAVLFDHPDKAGGRSISLHSGSSAGDTITFSGLPTVPGEYTVSYGMSWECSTEQFAEVFVDGASIASGVGGRDDGADVTSGCPAQDFNSLITQGSFGYDDDWQPTGTDGDEPFLEPAGATPSNSRQSDELYGGSYSGAGSMELELAHPTNSANVPLLAVSIIYDADSDGVAWIDDNCPNEANSGQGDLDADGLGDVCDADADGDGTDSPADCDDLDDTVNPDATEVYYDGIDQDCDGASDFDQDMDGADDQSFGGDDCNDLDDTIGPSVAEIPYDGIDQDCADGDLTDVDGDSYDAATVGGLDCDDDNAAVSPDATEVWYDGVDQDCDGGSDFDQDGDGIDSEDHGGTDCNDLDDTIFAGAVDIPEDGIDQDCDGSDAVVPCDDADNDTFADLACGGTDCDDGDANINPGEAEIPYDGQDNDCDAASLDDDLDQDGFVEADDCDDDDDSVYPGAPEIIDDGIDQDCDGADLGNPDADGDGFESTAVGGTDCDDFDPTVNPDAEEAPYDGVDQDCDGFDLTDVDGDGYDAIEVGGTDCDDSDVTIRPGAEEVWYDGVDQDCDGNDSDRDGDGVDGEDAGGDDCDDGDETVNPFATEVDGDGVDNDCDGVIDLEGEYTGSGCECDASSGAPIGWLSLAPLALILRRRRS